MQWAKCYIVLKFWHAQACTPGPNSYCLLSKDDKIWRENKKKQDTTKLNRNLLSEHHSSWIRNLREEQKYEIVYLNLILKKWNDSCKNTYNKDLLLQEIYVHSGKCRLKSLGKQEICCLIVYTFPLQSLSSPITTGAQCFFSLPQLILTLSWALHKAFQPLTKALSFPAPLQSCQNKVSSLTLKGN